MDKQELSGSFATASAAFCLNRKGENDLLYCLETVGFSDDRQADKKSALP
jgi:hypothetical protein